MSLLNKVKGISLQRWNDIMFATILLFGVFMMTLVSVGSFKIPAYIPFIFATVVTLIVFAKSKKVKEAYFGN